MSSSLISFYSDIGIPYFSHGCITMRQCVGYIHDPNMKLIFDVEIKFIGGFDMASCSSHTFFVF